MNSIRRVTIQVSAADLAAAYFDGTKTGAARVESLGITSKGRQVLRIVIGRNANIILCLKSRGQVWQESHRGTAPIDD